MYLNARGFSLAELLTSMCVTLMLLAAVSGAIVQTLHVQAFHAGRAAMGRTAAELSERLGEEARSATAVFIPSTDVLGEPNGPAAGAHEVDFFRRLSAGGDAFVAYRFDAHSGDVTRYEFTWTRGTKVVTKADVAASDISAFSLTREAARTTGAIVGERDPPAVSILYGTSELVGGNDVVIATVQTRERAGVAGSVTTMHLASRAAPTALAVLAPKNVATSPPGATRVFPFLILLPGFQVTLPHGPMHNGSPGGSPWLIHWVAAAGSVQFFGPSSDLGTWFEFSSFYGRVESGVYPLKSASGSSITAVVSCAGGPCPPFRPLPVSAPGITPSGWVAFEMNPYL